MINLDGACATYNPSEIVCASNTSGGGSKIVTIEFKSCRQQSWEFATEKEALEFISKIDRAIDPKPKLIR